MVSTLKRLLLPMLVAFALGCGADGASREAPADLGDHDLVYQPERGLVAVEKPAKGGGDGIVCGDGTCNVHSGCTADYSCCDWHEDNLNCPEDCPDGNQERCGDGICEPGLHAFLFEVKDGESYVTCPQDCPKPAPDCNP